MPPPIRPRPSPPPPDLLGRTSIEGAIDLFTYQSPDGSFAVARLQTEHGAIKISGNLFGIAKGERVRVEGEWKDHEKYGPTFGATAVLPIAPAGEKALRSYLGSGILKGVGESWANKLVDHFGTEIVDILNEHPERLAEMPKLSAKRARSIAASWEENRERHDALIFIQSHDLSPAVARRLVKFYGNDAARVLRSNPHQVALDVPLIGFHKADGIAAKMGIAPDSPQRLRAGLVHALSAAAESGHTCMTADELVAKGAELMRLDPAPVAEAVERAAAEGIVRREELPDGTTAFFMPSMYHCERGIAREVERLLRTARPLAAGDIDARIAAFEERFRFQLAANQRAAVRAACGGGVCVVTGGPGTGKTTLVRCLLHILRDEPIDVALAAPTGRAAQRLSETTRVEASTIHRLLKFNAATGRFTHDANNRLPVRLLLADEASMLDVPLAYSLLQAVMDGSSLVLVGDVAQLPSVGAGAVLKDLIESGRARTVRLNVVFRQAQQSLIIQNSHRILAGQMPLAGDGEGADGKPADYFFIPRPEPEAIVQTILKLVTERIPQRFGFDPMEDVQILSPMRRGPIGTIELNRVLAQTLNPDAPPLNGTHVRVGDRVMQTVNNYDLDVFNGDIGKVSGVDMETGELRVQFGRGVVSYPGDQWDQLDLAYAVTVHKSQGSEYPVVVMPLHTTHFVMLRRNLLYTAVTRGKKLVVVIGTHRALALAVKQNEEELRRTALRQWLLRPPQDAEELFET
ncbi:MAG: ATP-dependent RecD-like DNA helicase [Candidatus Sumerlaeia bacterium]|nr:ATP-dependent RecD-like DNA helicase [Candidatus Sumerlaeia bacterium]